MQKPFAMILFRHVIAYCLFIPNSADTNFSLNVALNPRLYNLNYDPFESQNLITDSSYSDVLSALEARLLYFNSVNQTQDFPISLKYLTENAFNKFGGITPLDYTDPPMHLSDYPQMIPNSTPNILFVLLDDVGINDLSFQNAKSTWLEQTPNIQGLALGGIRLTNHCKAVKYVY
jgi:hypothetical protein